MTLGLFVPRFGLLCLIGSSLAILGRSASAGFSGLVLFRGRLLLDRLFLLLGRLVTGGGKIHHLAGMCRGGGILAGIRRLRLFSLGDFGSSRLLHLGVGNSVGGIGYGLAHFKECRLSLMFQHDRLRVGQHRLGSGLLRHGGIFYRRSGSLGGRGCFGASVLHKC